MNKGESENNKWS